MSDLAFHPYSGDSQDEKSINVASCDVDGNVYLWPLPTSMEDDETQPEGGEQKGFTLFFVFVCM